MPIESPTQSHLAVSGRSAETAPQDDTSGLLLEGKSRVFRAALERLWRYAEFDDPIVIEGESGTGKTALARQAHMRSARFGEQFKDFSLADATDDLASSSLFGHVKGAFTGADSERKGFFRAAHHGTLFLDELGKTTLAVQRKLLRVVETGSEYPLGSDTEVRVNVRLIFASNVPMKKLVADGLMLPDLYARLRLFTVELPALRDRPEDIQGLVDFFLEKHAPLRAYKDPPVLSREARTTLYRAAWPYNVRELESAIIALLVEARPEDEITLGHFRSPLLLDVLASAAAGRHRQDPERVVEVFRAMEQNVMKTSEVLGLGREAVRSKLELGGISDAERRKLVKPGRRPKRAKGESDLGDRDGGE